MHKNVELLIGQLATDPGLRRRFAADPRGLLAGLVGRGVELTEVEVDALAALDPEAIAAFACLLDRRIRRAEPITNDLGEQS